MWLLFTVTWKNRRVIYYTCYGSLSNIFKASIIIDLYCIIQFSSIAQSCPTLCWTPWTTACQASWSLPKRMSIESVMPSNHVILCCLLLLLPSIFPSLRAFSKESAFHVRWPKYWSFNFNISPFNEHPGLISFRMDWLALLAVRILCY